jgi:prolyl oligopeptidase PreP (S9A serine peptidase family)
MHVHAMTIIPYMYSYSCPFRRGDRYFFLKNDGLQNQSVFYKQDSLDGKAEVLLDPNVLAADGTSSLGAYEISEDGRYLAYGVSKSGSDWQTVYVRVRTSHHAFVVLIPLTPLANARCYNDRMLPRVLIWQLIIFHG